MIPDPYYLSPPAQWITDRAARMLDSEVVVDDDLVNLALQYDPSASLVRVRPGLELPRLQYGLSRLVFGLVFPKAVPELTSVVASEEAEAHVPAPRDDADDLGSCPHCSARLEV